jgi:serine/threonine protein kinase
MVNPSTQLEGLTLPGGWVVGPLIPKKLNTSGGNFCQRYSVKSQSGDIAFLKALDFHEAFESAKDVTSVIERITVLFNYEKDLLTECRDRNMDRVVKAIESGSIRIDPDDPLSLVPYLIFEWANVDIRVHLDDASLTLPLWWKLRSLHHVATGLKQLHGADIVHQDLKPSNVLIFQTQTVAQVSKVADLGRASRLGFPSPFDSDLWAGDYNYAPPEVHYSFIEPEWAKRRIASDLYMLGGLVSFVFSKTTSIASLLSALPVEFWPSNWGSSFDDVLPYLLNAFAETVDQFAQTIPAKIHNDLLPVFRQLNHPDPRQRGFPGVRMNRNALERYLSKLDLMAYRAKAGRYY